MREMNEKFAEGQGNKPVKSRLASGLAHWLLERLRRVPPSQPRLALLDRISLAPRQTLALVEADGRRVLVATSPQAAPTFYVLDAHPIRVHQRRRSSSASHSRRVSW